MIRCECGRRIYSKLSTICSQCDPLMPRQRSLACPHRSEKIGLVDGCSKRIVFNCNKYNTYCSITSPQGYPYKLTNTGKKTELISSISHRSCSICKAQHEDS